MTAVATRGLWWYDLGRVVAPVGDDGFGMLTLQQADRLGSGLTFTSDADGNFLALDSGNGKTLWHAGSGSRINSSPITYQLDVRQYLITSSGSVLFAWALPSAAAKR
jgi:alcohol dehydrogenase (cytochrome c)